MHNKKIISFLIIPTTILLLGILGITLGMPVFYVIGTVIGIITIVIDSFKEIKAGRYSLDYIALLAMIVGIIAHQYAAGAIVALMFTGGKALEAFASGRAESSLKSLLDRIPKNVQVKQPDGTFLATLLTDAKQDDVIMVRVNELVPLDGILISQTGLFNQANLTGEPLPVTLVKDQPLKSGIVNVGETIELRVTGTFETSTYARIVELVKTAKQHEAPLVRVASEANGYFTVITLIISGAAFLITHDPVRLLAVLVLATPCPLIIAAPVAFIGGMSRAASNNIIIKKPGVLETIARSQTVFFDKTGTLTIGTPTLSSVEISNTSIDETRALAIANSIEFHSIHPLARAFVSSAQEKKISLLSATQVKETVGQGISGTVEGVAYTIAQAEKHYESGIALSLSNEQGTLATFVFTDILKPDAMQVMRDMVLHGVHIEVITGDTFENAKRIFGSLPITIHANCSPEEKYEIIDKAKEHKIVVMVGDGLNDAPALARAHAGIVFSGTENSAAIDAADAVILGSDIKKVSELFDISKRSLAIAKESIWTGIGLSIIGMVFAAFGFIIPVIGAFIQEGIDVSVILNSLRTLGE